MGKSKRTGMDRAKLRAIILELDRRGSSGIPEAIAALRELGAVPKQHEGRPPSQFTPEQVVEWYAGQALDLLEQRGDSLVHVLTLVNVLDKFVPEQQDECVFLTEQSKLRRGET